MIPISAEQVEALELASRYCGTLAAVERAYALGDMDDVETILGNVDVVELRLTQSTIVAIHRLWQTITEVRGGTATAPTFSPPSTSPQAGPEQSAAPPNVIQLDPWSRKVPGCA